jgi:polyphenol oxidase
LFSLSDDHYYRLPEWAKYEWLDHGFGTKTAAPPENLAAIKQVHSADVLVALELGLNGTGDALISRMEGIVAGVRTADCLPILLVDPIRRAVGAVHAGWRGTVQNITANAVAAMSAQFGTNPRDLEAGIGPGIAFCCFEVGPEVAREFGRWDSESKTHLDLQKANLEKLHSAGLRTIHVADLCTFCGVQQFFSYRREGEKAGRMMSYVGIRNGQAG